MFPTKKDFLDWCGESYDKALEAGPNCTGIVLSAQLTVQRPPVENPGAVCVCRRGHITPWMNGLVSEMIHFVSSLKDLGMLNDDMPHLVALVNGTMTAVAELHNYVNELQAEVDKNSEKRESV